MLATATPMVTGSPGPRLTPNGINVMMIISAYAVAKEQFEYNRNIAFSNDFPELQVKIQNEPIDLAPGEGMKIK